jgi:hypothetical protein
MEYNPSWGHPQQLSASSQPSGSYLFCMCDGTPKSPPLWRNLMLGGAMG